MNHQMNVSSSTERKIVQAHGMDRRGLSTYFKFGIVMVAAVVALMV